MKRLVLAGAGHAHLSMINSIGVFRSRDIRVTVIDPEETLWYSGMAPAGVSGRVAERALRIPVAEMVRRNGGEFIRARVTRIDGDARRIEIEGDTLAFDALSCSVGSRVDQIVEVTPDAPTPIGVKPVGALLTATGGAGPTGKSEVLPAYASGGVSRDVVIGGGPSGIELAGALLRRGTHVTLITNGPDLARRLPPTVGEIAAENLSRRGAEILYNARVIRIDGSRVIPAEGAPVPADRVFLATGLSVGGLFAESGLPVAPDGAVRVDTYLRVPDTPVFAGGDCATVADYSLQRAGVHAVRQGPILRNNLMAVLGGDRSRLKPYTPPVAPLLIVNLGDDSAICVRGDRVFHGNWCAALKLRIDWVFVRSEGRRIIPSFLGPPRPPGA